LGAVMELCVGVPRIWTPLVVWALANTGASRIKAQQSNAICRVAEPRSFNFKMCFSLLSFQVKRFA
jgi:hypothetical protein